MKLHPLLAAIIALSAIVPSPAAAQPSAEARQIDWALERGRLLFGLDRSAWVATHDLLKRMPNAEAKGVIGYVVERVERPEVFEGGARPELTAAQARLARAFEAAHQKAAQLPRCGSDPFNVAIVPAQSADNPLDVYLMTPQTAAGFPLGGHHRFTLDATSREIARRSFARSCLRMAKEPNASGAQPVAMVVSHLLDPIPTEIHVFTALAAQVSVYVVIARPRRLFEVNGQGIRLVRASKQR